MHKKKLLEITENYGILMTFHKTKQITKTFPIAKNNFLAHRDDPDTSIIEKMLEEGSFFPGREELEDIRAWVVYNELDMLTAHIPELSHLRGSVRFALVFH